MKTWTRIEDYVARGNHIHRLELEVLNLDRKCVFPDCLIDADGCRVCEHACPFESEKLK